VEVTEVLNFLQDNNLLSEDVMILDCQNATHMWVGQHASNNDEVHSWDIASRYHPFLHIREEGVTKTSGSMGTC
jgi:hypothetical protein